MAPLTRALILALAALLHRGTPRPETVDAIASSGATDYEVALLVVYAARESSWRPDAVGDGGRSCGTWQQSCTRVAGMIEAQRARVWLSDVRASSLAAVDSSPSRAARRAKLAAEMLGRVGR